MTYKSEYCLLFLDFFTNSTEQHQNKSRLGFLMYPHHFAVCILESTAALPAEVKGVYAETSGIFTAIGNLVDCMDSLNVENWVEYQHFCNIYIPLQFPPGYVGVCAHQICLLNQGLYAQDDHIS